MEEPLPGQFYMLQVSSGLDPLLKRAFSLFRRTSYGIQLLYRIVGKGTSLMRDLKEGKIIDVLGPLGNGYPAPSAEEIPLVIAGGIGMASVFPFVEKMPGRAYVFYGAKTKDEILMVEELRKVSKELFISTDDGTCEKKGTALGLLNHFLLRRGQLLHNFVIYACGPRPLMREVSGVAADHGLKANLSLEEHMACGIGACLGCVTKTKAGYRRVCKEGPVFGSGEIEW